MSIAIQCGRCGKKFSAARTLAGRNAPCPQCKAPAPVIAGASAPAYTAHASFGGTAADDIVSAEIVAQPAGLPLGSFAPAKQLAKPQTTQKRSCLPVFAILAAVGLVAVGVVGYGVYKIANAIGGGPLSPESRTPFDVAAIPPPQFPPRPSMQTIAPGVRFGQVWLPVSGGPGQANELYLYLPEGNHAPRSLGCVFIAPAGATVFSGMELAAGDQPEHLPYVQAGFAVVAYAVDGEMDSDGDAARAYREYRDSLAGLVNARNAIEYALAQMPEVDPNRLYTAGHSSAGRQALLLAEHEPRIKAVISYNGVADVVGDTGVAVYAFQSVMPGVRDFLARSSPLTHVERLNCAVRIFHSEGDERIPVDDARDFYAVLPASAQPRELHIVPGGDHYTPMIEQGLPAGVAWLTTLDQQLGGSPHAPAGNVGPGNGMPPGFYQPPLYPGPESFMPPPLSSGNIPPNYAPPTFPPFPPQPIPLRPLPSTAQ